MRKRFLTKVIAMVMTASIALTPVTAFAYDTHIDGVPDEVTAVAKGKTTYVKAGRPTAEEIAAYMKEHPVDWTMEDEYDVKPNKEKYEAGLLSLKTLKNALNAINVIRYTAGVPTLEMTDEQLIANSKWMQESAMLAATNGKLSHTQSIPTDKNYPEDQIASSVYGCGNANMSRNRPSIIDSIVKGWVMDNSSVTNLTEVGHRLNLLDPQMAMTGFGHVDDMLTMYSTDYHNPTKISDYVAWPTANTPVELLGAGENGVAGLTYPWSITLGHDYKIPKDRSGLKITMVDNNTGKEYVFDSVYNGTGNPTLEGYMSVSRSNTVVWRPALTDKVIINADSSFSIKLEGITDRDGNPMSIEYEAKTFQASELLKEDAKESNRNANLESWANGTQAGASASEGMIISGQLEGRTVKSTGTSKDNKAKTDNGKKTEIPTATAETGVNKTEVPTATAETGVNKTEVPIVTAETGVKEEETPPVVEETIEYTYNEIISPIMDQTTGAVIGAHHVEQTINAKTGEVVSEVAWDEYY